jgi:protein SCO1/2
MPKLTLLRKLLWAAAGLGVAVWLGALIVVDSRSHDGVGAALIDPDFELSDQTGAPVRDEDLRGRWLLVFFGFTNCPDVCPTTLAEIATARDDLGPLGAQMRPVFISVDPERDTPEALADYVSAFGDDVVGLTGPRPAIEAATRNFKGYARRASNPNAPDGYSVDHTTYLYLIDPDGRFVTFYRYGLGADALAEDLRTRLGDAS